MSVKTAIVALVPNCHTGENSRLQNPKSMFNRGQLSMQTVSFFRPGQFCRSKIYAMKVLNSSANFRSSANSKILDHCQSALKLATRKSWKRLQPYTHELGHSSMKTKAAESDDFEVDEFEDFESSDIDMENEEDAVDDGQEILNLEGFETNEAQFPLLVDGDDNNASEAVWSELEEVDYLIDEEKFHKIQLHKCSFFIGIAPDKDDDVYNFLEVYVASPDSERYAIPKLKGVLPEKPVRCTKAEWKSIQTKEVDLTNAARQPSAKSFDEVFKVFLFKHHLNRRGSHRDFVLNYEEIYVLDGEERSIQRAEVQVDVPGGRKRDRKKDLLIVRDNGTTFRIIPEQDRRTPDDIIEEFEFEHTKAALEAYLRGYRDFEKSNWF